MAKTASELIYSIPQIKTEHHKIFFRLLTLQAAKSELFKEHPDSSHYENAVAVATGFKQCMALLGYSFEFIQMFIERHYNEVLNDRPTPAERLAKWNEMLLAVTQNQ